LRPTGTPACFAARSDLLDAHAADRAGNHQLLDLLGALEDVEVVLDPSGTSLTWGYASDKCC
jgi:hypothetical protein